MSVMFLVFILAAVFIIVVLLAVVLILLARRPKGVRCPHCGKNLKSYYKICPYCGTPFERGV